jgi:multidrug resistance efflux pump
MKRILLAVLVVLIGVAALMWQQMQVEPLVVSGYLEADDIRLGSRVGGRVQEVLVEEGQVVERGTLLVKLEPFDLLQRLAEAQQTLAAAAAEADKMAAGFRAEEKARTIAMRDLADAEYREAQAGPRPQEIQEARDNLSLANADLELAELNFTRREDLFKRKTISQEEFDRAVAERKAARAKSAAAKSRLDLLLEGTRKEEVEQAQARLMAAESDVQLHQAGYREQDIIQAKAQRDAAQAQVQVIERQIAELDVRASTDGVIEAIELRPGDIVPASAPVISLMDTTRLWVRAYIPQVHLGLVPLDKRLAVRVDAVPDKTFVGRVIYVAQQAEFSPDNIQTPEERSKQVFRVKVQIEGDRTGLRPGMTADVLLEEELRP